MKIVLHVSDTWHEYGQGGELHRTYQTANPSLTFVPFLGYIDPNGEAGKRFQEECKTADVIVLDAWDHDVACGVSVRDAQDKEADLAAMAKSANPSAKLFAILMERSHEVAVHAYAAVAIWYDDSRILAAIKGAA